MIANIPRPASKPRIAMASEMINTIFVGALRFILVLPKGLERRTLSCNDNLLGGFLPPQMIVILNIRPVWLLLVCN